MKEKKYAKGTIITEHQQAEIVTVKEMKREEEGENKVGERKGERDEKRETRKGREQRGET